MDSSRSIDDFDLGCTSQSSIGAGDTESCLTDNRASSIPPPQQQSFAEDLQTCGEESTFARIPNEALDQPVIQTPLQWQKKTPKQKGDIGSAHRRRKSCPTKVRLNTVFLTFLSRVTTTPCWATPVRLPTRHTFTCGRSTLFRNRSSTACEKSWRRQELTAKIWCAPRIGYKLIW